MISANDSPSMQEGWTTQEGGMEMCNAPLQARITAQAQRTCHRAGWIHLASARGARTFFGWVYGRMFRGACAGRAYAAQPRKTTIIAPHVSVQFLFVSS